MPDWVRTNTAGLSVAGADLDGAPLALSNPTAPADFDPANVIQVTIAVTVSISGAGDDGFTMGAGDGAGIQTSPGGTVISGGAYDAGLVTNQTSGSNTATQIDSAPPVTGFTIADWESAEVDDAGANARYAAYVQNMGPDGRTLAIGVGDITVTITYTSAAVPSLVVPPRRFPRAIIVR